MGKFDYDIGIIGGGAAGLTVTSGAAQLGAKTILIEKEAALGGDCLHYGCVPSKTLIKSAKVYHSLKGMVKYGLPDVDQKPVDFTAINSRIKNVIEHIQVHDSVERFSNLGADITFGDASFDDEHVVNVDGKRVSANKWVIATGSSPAMPNIQGLADIQYLTNKNIFSLPYLPEHLVVIGGGAIAIEMAQAFCRLGSKVSVIQRSDQILSKEDKDMATLVLNQLKSEGVVVYLQTAILDVFEKNNEKIITFLTKEGSPKTLKGSDIFVALGREPNVDDLGLSNCGVDLGSNGIVVDSKLRTSQKNIFAAGDVIGGHQFTHAAGYEGGIVLSNAVLHFPRKTDYKWMPWCTYCAPELASIGINEKYAESKGITYSLWEESFDDNDRAITEADEVGKIKLLLDDREKPLGIQILGTNAGDLLGHWIAALNGGVKLSKLAGAIHPYPTFAEINKRVSGDVFKGKIFSPKVKKALKFIFSYRGE